MSTQQEDHEKIKLDIEEGISIEVATERKQEGNDFFRAGKWDEATVAYRSALGCLPKRPKKLAKSSDSLDDDGEEHESKGEGKGKAPEGTGEKEVEDVVEVVTPAVDESENEVRKLRAVLNANIGACYVKLGNHKEAVEACTEALLDDPNYIRALERRVASNETLNTWSSLTSAQDDYNKLLSVLSSPSQIVDIRRKLLNLKPRLETAQKKETDEMMSKLKGLGNSLLGNFGLSTDNFKFVPNEQGGYSVNFTQ